MSVIVSMQAVTSIKVGPGSTVLPDGTIVNPEPYEAVDIALDDGIVIQVERPLTTIRVRAAYQNALTKKQKKVDETAVGDVV